MWAWLKAWLASPVVPPAKRHWRAASPSGTVEIGFLTDDEAIAAAQKLGAVSYIDREYCVVFYNTQFGSQSFDKQN